MIASSVGNGPDLALIHGWGLGSHVWQPVLELLTPRCRVHLIDLPGYGTSAASANISDDFTKTAQALVDALPAGTTLCGWSLGGLLALQAALLAPQPISRLILVGSTPSFMQRENWLTAQPPALLDAFNEALRSDTKTTLQRFIALLNQGDAQARAINRALTRSTFDKALPDIATLSKGLGWLRDVDLRAHIPAIKTPTLLIHGECDPLMPLASAQWLNGQLPNAQLAVFAATAHAPFLADPLRFAALAGDFCHDAAAV